MGRLGYLMRYGNVSEDLKKVIEDSTKRFKENDSTFGPLDEVEIEIWMQTWGSTALGFGGIGGQCITSAYTFLAWDKYRQNCLVYFAGRFAYQVKNVNDAFRKAYTERRMPSIREASKLEIA
jgi:hypothetical protein